MGFISEKELLGAILYADADMSASDILDALNAQMAGDERRIGDILIDKGHCSPEKVLKALAKQNGCLGVADLGQEIYPDIIRLISRDIALKYRVLPIGVIKNDDKKLKVLTVVISEPGDVVFVRDTLRFQFDCEIKILLAPNEDLDRRLLHYYGDEPTEQGIERIKALEAQLEEHCEQAKLIDELMYAFHAAITRPMGTVPACGDKFYDPDHPALRRDARSLDLDTKGNTEEW